MMIITAIDYMKIFVPWKASFKEPMLHWRAMSGTTPEEEDSYVVVQVHTDEGLVGLGEGGRSLDEAKEIGERLIGQNPMALDAFNMQPPFLHAVFDLMGQALGVPVCQLLGGRYREQVPVAYWSPYLPPEETARHAEEGIGLGFKVHKIKARPWDCAAQVKAIAAAAGHEYAIRIDPNETLGLPAVTARIDDEIAAYNVECLEDPVPKARPEWYALLRKKCATPLAIHTRDTAMILNMARLDAMDYVNVGGTPNQARAAAAVADAAGCPVWVQFEGHCLDIAAAFNVHVGAAIPNATLPGDILHFLREGYLSREPLIPADGLVAVPTAPGLGVELDEAAVERYRVA
jgi:L-alanine-DL-glutamate epimerase-like enolase superfamily enzyme